MAKEVFIRTKPHVNVSAVRESLSKAGMSVGGIQALLAGDVMANPEDRKIVARVMQDSLAALGYQTGGSSGDVVPV